MAHVLEYQWDWSVIPSYFFYFDDQSNGLKSNILVQGFFTTIKLGFWATAIGFLLGTISGVMGAKGLLEHRLLSWTYVETIRNVPSLVLVIIFYYFVSSQFLDALGLDQWMRNQPDGLVAFVELLFAKPAHINAFISAVIALGIYEGAYISEIVRGGILAIPQGQWEASLSMGLSRRQTFLLIILPQVLRKTAFPMVGQFISAIKDSAIVSVISIQELTFQGLELMAATFLTFEVWTTITILYFILTFPLSMAVSVLEKKFAVKG